MGLHHENLDWISTRSLGQSLEHLYKTKTVGKAPKEEIFTPNCIVKGSSQKSELGTSFTVLLLGLSCGYKVISFEIVPISTAAATLNCFFLTWVLPTWQISATGDVLCLPAWLLSIFSVYSWRQWWRLQKHLFIALNIKFNSYYPAMCLSCPMWFFNTFFPFLHHSGVASSSVSGKTFDYFRSQKATMLERWKTSWYFYQFF